ncbi:DUF1127 domain-containing protein [Falsirhodobacter xinxiangensis]|uniref:DUF1127 domain-containing protein n=1 Tax=Falsirhodobacter xinxiangensis TaxID=2530049 RepID=UPI0010AAB252|nr:DUF1127 domain-containing protein [Rhodobacter xinxiangensis]
MIALTQTKTVQPLPPFARVAFVVAETVLSWEIRRHTRRKLKHLDAYLLRDIGLSAHDAQVEIDKPFWQG